MSTMKKDTVERLDMLKTHLINTYKDGKFSATTKDFLQVLVLDSNNSNQFYMKKLIQEGFLRKTKNAEKNGIRWNPAEYEIVEIVDKKVEPEVSDEGFLESVDGELENVDVNNYIAEDFNNIPMRLYKTNRGYVVPITDIINAIGTSRQSIHQLLDRNWDLFKSWLINVTLISRENGNKSTCLTRDGVIGILMKVSYNRLPEDKQKRVLEFQRWAIEKLSQLIVDGNVTLTDQEHAKIQHDIGDVMGMSEEEIDKLFNEVTLGIEKFFNSAKNAMKNIKEENETLHRKTNALNQINTKLITQTVQLRERLYAARQDW